MNEEILFDVFRLCWDIILEESIMNGNGINMTHLNSEHWKNLDTTDTDFDILENRLAYTYKYGCYNAHFLEKCVLNFLNECKDFEDVFPQKKFKVCSLSNGPGFDIIGLLSALCKSNRPLKSFQKLNAVNVFSSWLTLYKALINKACLKINLKFTDYVCIKPENVNLFQGDILLSTLPLQAKKCISKSNVLLMVKTFFSSKATVNKFACSLRRLFLLLKPGTLIFFIGSKKDMNNFSRRPFLSNYVNTIYGPQTVILENIIIDENFSGIIGQEPLKSGQEEFVVWQKKNATDMQASIKEFKENNMSKCSKKKSVGSNENIVNELLNETDNCDYSSDSESKLSHTTSESSKLSYALTSELKNHSYSNDFDSTSLQMKSAISLISPTLSQSDNAYLIEEVISMLDKVYLDCVNYNDIKTNSSTQNQLCSDNASDLANKTEKKINGKSLINSVPGINNPKSSVCVNSSISNLMKNTIPQVLENSAQESKDILDLKYIVSAPTNAKFPSDTNCLSYQNTSENSSIKETRENEITDQPYKINDHFEHSLHSQKDPTITFPKILSTFEKSCENIILQENNIDPTAGNKKKLNKDLNDMETPNLNVLGHHCGNLITALEKLTISLENYVKSSKSYLKVNKHCFGQICKNSQLSHQCCCCVKIIHACSCKKICNC